MRRLPEFRLQQVALLASHTKATPYFKYAVVKGSKDFDFETDSDFFSDSDVAPDEN